MSIGEYLEKIRNAVYGREVRESIAKGIETAYNDASEKHDNANMEVKLARGTHSNLNNRLKKMDEVDRETTTQLAHIDGKKIDKNRGAVTSADLSQEVKEQMTGGSVAVVGKNTVLTENIVDEQVTPEKTTFVRHSKNLYNKNTSIDNTTLVSGGEVIPHTGVAEEDLRTTSDFIPILGNTTYISNERIILQVYGEDKNPIGVLRDIHKDAPLVSVSLARYVRLSIRKMNKETLQFEQGSVPTEYEPYGLIIEDLVVDGVSSFMTEENEEWRI